MRSSTSAPTRCGLRSSVVQGRTVDRVALIAVRKASDPGAARLVDVEDDTLVVERLGWRGPEVAQKNSSTTDDGRDASDPQGCFGRRRYVLFRSGSSRIRVSLSSPESLVALAHRDLQLVESSASAIESFTPRRRTRAGSEVRTTVVEQRSLLVIGTRVY